MRSELSEISQIDRYLLRQLSEEDAQTFKTTLLCDNTLAEKVETQRLIHRLVRLFARKQQRHRLEEIHSRLLNEKAFAHQLKTIFT